MTWKGIGAHVLDEAGVAIEENRVRLPYFWPDGSLHRERIVLADGTRWWSTGEGLIPYGLELLPPPKIARISILLIAEGESDALALREATCVIGGIYVLGVPGALTWKPAWSEYLAAFPEVYVIADGDRPGMMMIEKVVASLPWAIPVPMPDGEDARSLLQREGPAAVTQLVDVAVTRALDDARLRHLLRLYAGVEL